MTGGEAVAAFAALAHAQRLAIVRLLARSGEPGLPAGAIAESLGVPNSSISFHLGQLRRAGLIRQRRLSRMLIYSSSAGAAGELAAYLLERCCADR